jgi:hypothetical protein
VCWIFLWFGVLWVGWLFFVLGFVVVFVWIGFVMLLLIVYRDNIYMSQF